MGKRSAGAGGAVLFSPTNVDSRNEKPKSSAKTDDAIPTPRASAGYFSPISANVNAYTPIESAVPTTFDKKNVTVAA